MRYAWPKIKVVFSIHHENDTRPPNQQDPSTILKIGPHRDWPKLFAQHPVDLVVVEKGDLCLPRKSPHPEAWEKSIAALQPLQRPKLVIEAWRSDAQLWVNGPASKSTLTRWKKLGYNLHCRKVNATSIGGAIDQDRLIVVRVHQRENLHWHWDSLNRSLEHRRPMENLLTPPGLVPRKLYLRGKQRPHSPQAGRDPMPPKVGSIIQTEKGTRRLTQEELARGLGIPKGEETGLGVKSLHRSSSLFHWEYLSRSLERLQELDEPPPTPSAGSSDPSLLQERSEHHKSNSSTSTSPKALHSFSWQPPDLKEDGEWCRQRTANLCKAARAYVNTEEVFQDGL